MVVPVASFKRRLKNLNWQHLVLFLMIVLGFLFFLAWPILLNNSKEGEKGLAQNNIAFVLQLTAGTNPSKSRFVYRLKQCLGSIFQHSSITLTIHLFVNAVGKDAALKILEEVGPYCVNGYMVKFYDVEKVIDSIRPAVNVIKVSLDVTKSSVTGQQIYLNFVNAYEMFRPLRPFEDLLEDNIFTLGSMN